MRIAVNRCVNCLCRCCSKFYCPYIDSRCNVCYNNDFNVNIDCDWFENIKTARKRLKVVRKGSKSKDNINVKLDYIIEQMGLVAPFVDRAGTFDIMYKGSCLARVHTYADVEQFIKKYQPQLKSRLEVIEVQINL